MLTVIATIRARPGSEAPVREGLEGLLAPTRAEEGCLSYDLHVDPKDPGLFVFYETWESEPHLDAHLESAHITANRERIGSLLDSLEILRLQRV